VGSRGTEPGIPARTEPLRQAAGVRLSKRQDLAIAVAGAAALLIAEAVIGNWRLTVAVALIVAAVALLLANIRDFFIKR
jgi:hypothetical protein